MPDLFGPFIEFGFMRRALVGTVALSILAGPIGVFLMLRRMSLTGDAMSHAILPGVAAGYLVSGLSVVAMTIGGLFAGLGVALISGILARSTILREDATLAALTLGSLAAGVLMISARGSTVDLFHLLFGNVLALDDDALLFLGATTTIGLTGLALVWRPLVIDTVDTGFLRSLSRGGDVAHLAFLGLVVFTLVAAFQALGTLLAVGLMILPAVAARFSARTLDAMAGLAALYGASASVIGLIISYHADLATGPAIILSASAISLVALVFGPADGLIARYLPRRHLEA
jgi:zinc/manganese transport system permease protein